MNNARHLVRVSAVAGALSLLPSLAHAHTSDDGLLHEVAHFVFGGQHLYVIPAVVVVIGAIAFGAIRRFRSSER